MTDGLRPRDVELLPLARNAGVFASTLLIVGELDTVVSELNRRAMTQLACPTRVDIVPGATHLFEEPGTRDRVFVLATAWFMQYLDEGARS